MSTKFDRLVRQVAREVRQRRLGEMGVGYASDPILEIEMERGLVPDWPSRYAVAGLRLHPDGRVLWSLEPMTQPEFGDARPDAWDSRAEERRLRRKFAGLRRQLTSRLDKLGLRWGRRVAEIHADAP